MSTTTSDSASSDRLQSAIASARVVIAVSLAMFPFGWPPTTLTQAAITLGLAAAMLALGVAQLLRPQARRLPRIAARLDAVIAVAAVWTYPEDHNRLLFGLVLLSMLEAAALLDGRWLLAIWLFDIGGYAALEANHPGGDGVSVIIRIFAATVLAVAVRAAVGRADAQRERFARLTEGLQAIVWEIDRRGRITYVNDHARRLFGPGIRRIERLLQLPDGAFVARLFDQGAADTQIQVRTLDGRELWLAVSGSVSQGRRSRAAGAHGVAHDITAIRQAEQRLRDVFDTVDLLATITAVDGRIVYINQALAAASGRTPEELIGRDWIETLSSDADTDVVEHFYSELRAGRIVRRDENSIETPDGDVRLIAWSNTMLRNADGNVFGAASIGQDITDQRTAESSLRASEERFRTLSQNAPVGIFQTDADGGCSYVNERWMQMTGLELEQARGRGWGGAIHRDDYEAVAQRWRCVCATGQQLSMEFRFQRPDGAVVWTHAIAVALRDWDGNVSGFIGTCVDITERRQAEAAVIESERRLRTITDNMTDVIFVYGMDHRLQWVTPSVQGLTGYSVAELFERNTLDDVHPDDLARMLERWRALFDGEGYTGAEFRIVSRDGTEKWCWSAGSPIFDQDGSQIGVQIRDADISLRKNAELRVRESEHRSRAIIETTSDAFFSADGSGTIQEWNRAAEQIFGVPRAEAVGAGMFELVVSEPGREVLERGLGALGTDGEATVELVARNRESGDFAAEMRLWPMLVEGSLTLNAFVRDITERKLREEQYTFMAYHDPLTGLPNRAMLEQHLELVLVRARHDSSAAALLYLDIDRFKQANDSYGHEAGDQLLCDVATRLRAAARSGDLVVRLGGDEFVVVLGDLPSATAADVAKAVADRVHEGLSQPFDLNGAGFQSSASIGIALFPDDGADAAALLTAADTGMYVSKRAGRGKTSFPLGSRRAA